MKKLISIKAKKNFTTDLYRPWKETATRGDRKIKLSPHIDYQTSYRGQRVVDLESNLIQI